MKKLCLGFGMVFFLIASASRDAGAWLLYNNNLPSPLDAAAQSYLDGAIGRFQHQPKLARGFANAGVFSSHAATQRGYQGYDKVAITVGTMAAAQVPATTTDLSYYKKIGERLQREGDLYAGVAWNAWSLQVGFKVPMTDIYLSGKFGKLKYTYQDYSFDGMHVGCMLNYQIIKQKAPPIKFVRWRGLSIGTGFLYQYNNTIFSYKVTPVSLYGGILSVKPVLGINARTKSYVIPLEISTSIQLLWVLNIHAGCGIDFAWGSSDLRYSAIGMVTAPSPPFVGLFGAYGRQKGKGSSNYMPKIFCGPGAGFGPVFVDIPFTYYFNGGFNVGITLGVVF